MPELTHDEAVVNGVRLHYIQSGDGPLVLLLHGFPEFWYSWREQIPALAAAGYHVVAPDMRGYNASEKPHGVDAYRTDELVADVTGLIDHFGEESAHVVGHDWGGAVAWQVGIERPERVDKLAVLNAPHPERFREELRTPSQLKRSWYMFFFQLPWLPELFLSARGYESIENIFRDSAKNPEAFDEEDVRRYVEAAAQPGALTGSINYYRALFRENVPAAFRSLLGKERESLDVTVPTMLIWGTEDFALGNELTEGMDRWVSDLRIERLSDASHWVQNDRPERVNGLLTEFLAE
ncbi:alpha/beta fold hydrolase [Haladaptatus sp. CMAA 1911]|uniref:alpha/beta fold hydrolase n=1 Tax=unclassified Haladaptatus TaxID=2622732 RepID=UPI0037542CA9